MAELPGVKSHDKNEAEFSEREVTLINDWDKGGFSPDSIKDIISGSAAFVDVDPGFSRWIVSLQAFGWDTMGQRFIYDKTTKRGDRLHLPRGDIAGYVRDMAPDPINSAATKGPEKIREAIADLMRENPILKPNESVTVSVGGLGSARVSVDCKQGTTVGELKGLIPLASVATPVFANRLALTFDGQALENTSTLYEAGVGDGGLIEAEEKDGPSLTPSASALVSDAPPGKMMDILTMNTMSTILEGAALQTWDLLPGYGFHNAGTDSVERVALAAREAQKQKSAPKPIVFVSMRHTQPRSAALEGEPLHFVLLDAANPQTPAALKRLATDQVAVVVSGGVPGPLFNQLASSATLPIVLEGAGTASFAIERGIPYIALKNNPSIMELPSNGGGKRLQELGDWLPEPKATSGAKYDEGEMILKLAKIMLEGPDESAPMGRYFKELQAEMRSPDRHQMAAAFEQLYDKVTPALSIRGVSAGTDPIVLFKVTFDKAPATDDVDRLLMLAPAGTVNVASVVKTMRRVAPDAGSAPVAVCYEVSVTGVVGKGKLTASLAPGAFKDLGGADFPAATGEMNLDLPGAV